VVNDPVARRLTAQIGAHASWAATEDRTARTANARAAFAARFEREVDPDGRLAPEERARRAEHARLAFMASIRLKGHKARRKAAELAARREAEAADATLAALGE
jgi:hypothetical protein